MPNYEDLHFLKDKLLSLGKEVEVLLAKNETPNLTDIPEKIEAVEDKSFIDSDDLLNDINEDFNEGLSFSEDEDFEMKEEENKDNFLDNISFDDVMKENETLENEPLSESVLDDFDDDKNKNTPNKNSDWNDIKDDSFETLDSINLDENNLEDGIDEMSALLGRGADFKRNKEESTSDFDLGDISFNEEPKEESASDFDLGDISFNEEPKEGPTSDFDLGDISFNEEPKEESASDFDLGDISFNEEPKEESASDFDLGDISFNKEPKDDKNDLMDLMTEIKPDESELSLSVSDDFITNNDEDIPINPLGDDLVDLAGDFAETEISGENKPKEINDTLADIVTDEVKEDGFDLSSLDDFSAENNDENNGIEEINEELPSFDSESSDIIEDGAAEFEDSPEDISQIKEDFDFGDIDNFTVDNDEDDKESSSSDETYEIEDSDVKNEEESPQKKDKSELDDNERKQIVITLSGLPKEAKKKIIETIINGKYSDNAIRPLIDSLIENDKPQTIIKIYEKITGDASLSKSVISKYTGSDFEERQKSFAYVFKKNILPIISRIAGASILLFLLIFIYSSFIYPTMQASKYYKLGKKNIKEKKFWDVEPYFEKAYSIQPSYKEVVEYARLYRNSKRYLEAEKKYYFGLNMKPNEPLTLEFADFFREIRDFERSIKLYDEMLRKNRKNVEARLGLAKTYLDFSEESLSQIDSAREEFLNVLDIDKNNFEATFALLDIHLRQKNHKEILRHYNYIEKKFKNKVDPKIYSDLADYFIDNKEVDDIKNILSKAAKNAKGKIYPQINYFYAKYMRFMNTSSEEKNFLENAEKSFEVMKKVDPVRYETSYYRDILSKVYNDLGESYDRFSKINIKAEEYYLKSIDANPEYGKPYYNLGNFALKNKVDYDGALKNYLFAEKYGFSNDTQNYNMGWLYYKKEDFYMSYNKIGKLLDKYPDNSNLKFMIGSIFYKMSNYELSEGMLLETYNHFEALRQINYPVDMSTKEGRAIITMLTKASNNLGAALQKRYEQTKNSKYIVWATKYYSDSIEFFAKMKDIPEDIKKEESFQIDERVRYKKFDIENANQNLRMILYPEAGFDEPILYDDFSLDFKTTM